VLAIGFSRIFLGVHFFSDVAAGYAAAMMWLAICVSGCEVARRREQMRRFLSQLLTNERSKLAIEVALLSRRSFLNGGLGQARRGAYEKDPQLTPTSRLAGVELLAAPRTEIPRSASLIPHRDYFGRNHFSLRTAEAGRQTDLKSLQTVLRGKGSGEQRREARNRAVQAENANCYDNAQTTEKYKKSPLCFFGRQIT
jgi:hypothetical protein